MDDKQYTKAVQKTLLLMLYFGAGCALSYDTNRDFSCPQSELRDTLLNSFSRDNVAIHFLALEIPRSIFMDDGV